ncbi:MAG TPA: porin, partial [Achromobacter sp.]|nr:porin [Achromobacter sp.]
MVLNLLRWRGLAACTLLLPALPLWAAEDADDQRPVTATFGGRLHLDFADFDNDYRGTPNKDDTEIRRAWLDMSGRFFVVDYKLEADFSGDQVEAKDVYISRDFSGGKLSVGQFKQFFSLDDRTGSNYGSFLERGNAGTTLAPLYRLGASWQAARGDMTWAASAYSLESIDAWQVKGRAAGGRVTWSPSPSDGDVLHLGLSLAHERYDSPGANGVPALRIRPRPAGHLSDNSRL